jgi:hypothetical protein
MAERKTGKMALHLEILTCCCHVSQKLLQSSSWRSCRAFT